MNDLKENVVFDLDHAQTGTTRDTTLVPEFHHLIEYNDHRFHAR